ncbi:hypothetical protein WM2015_3039 [Wenzhouxiangella marina]|uniref:Uncharacterized protein n=2 Tax=Wenzhouxiangella marina TaxID=1579979 RepID=A0A0K0Y0J4_9GAMM|nr:hypothetical protein WM2015_3039 [Wenzhouxiangella marina]
MRSGSLDPSDFDHRAHLRLAYVVLTRGEVDAATETLRSILQRYLAVHGIDPAKYHETLTRAWMLAVRHFMVLTPTCRSSEAFIEANPQLLDPRIMLSHYSSERLFSDEARAHYLSADLEPIPLHAS